MKISKNGIDTVLMVFAKVTSKLLSAFFDCIFSWNLGLFYHFPYEMILGCRVDADCEEDENYCFDDVCRGIFEKLLYSLLKVF